MFITLRNVDRFLKKYSVTVKLSGKFAKRSMSYFAPQLQCADTLAYENIISKNTRRWHVTISCQPVRPWKSGRVHLAECSNVVVLELPYSTEFGRESRKFASGVRKYGKFSHFFDPPCSLWWTRKKQILSSLSTANVYRL